jgi:hypothetical protein
VSTANLTNLKNKSPMTEQPLPPVESTAMDVKKTARKPLPPGPGRPKGVPNKTTVALKEAILAAAEGAGGQAGLIGYLRTQACENPTSFMALLGKVLPLTIAGDKDNPLKAVTKIQVEFVRP